MPAKTWFMQMQEAKANAMSETTGRDIEAVVRRGEIAYDAGLKRYYNAAYQFLMSDDEQAMLDQWQHDGRIVVDGESVRMRGVG